MTKPKMKRLLEETEIPDKLTIRDVYLYILDTNERIDGFERKVKRIVKPSEEISHQVSQTLERVSHLYVDTMKRIAAWEESMLYIMHNIKKSQYLYSHYPDDWVKEYTDIKEGLVKENEYMDKKIEKVTKGEFNFGPNPGD